MSLICVFAATLIAAAVVLWRPVSEAETSHSVSAAPVASPLDIIRAAEARLEARLYAAPPPLSPVVDTEEDALVSAIVELQPSYRTRPSAARRLAGIISDAAEAHGQNVWIALAVAFKESSLRPSVGDATVTGELGEEGYFQVMPRGYASAVCGRGRDMGNARANADTAMCYLGVVQSSCDTEDPWQYVAAYGMKRCPRPGEGRSVRGSKRARAVLCRVRSDCDEIWPE